MGNLGAVFGSIVSARLMLRFTKKVFGTEAYCDIPEGCEHADLSTRSVRPGGFGARLLARTQAGALSQQHTDFIFSVIGEELGIVGCTFVLLLTKGPGEGGVYTGAAYEGVAVLPWLGQKLSFILKPLFGFTSAEGIAVPITALGAAGAAIGLVPGLLSSGLAGAQDIAVFTAMCMCWSGYLSTHVAMMSSLKCTYLTGRAILCHTIGGLCAGVFAHWVYALLSLL